MYNIKYNSIEKLGELLEQIQKPKIFEEGEYIFHQGDKTNIFFYLKSGACRTFSISKNGNEKTVFILKKKGIFAASSFFTGDPIRRSCAVALKKSEIIIINKKIVDMLINKHPSFALSIIQDMSRDINHMYDDITSTNFYNSKEKLASFICKCIINNDFYETNNIKYINYTQDDISKIIGLSRPTINKTLSYYKSKKILDTKYKKIIILDYDYFKKYNKLKESI